VLGQFDAVPVAPQVVVAGEQPDLDDVRVLVRANRRG
jgi:hypothetical protein